MPEIRINKKIAKFFPPVIGALCGLLYVALDEDILPKLIGIHPSPSLIFIHDVIDFLLPIFFGVLIAVGIGFLRRQSRLNKYLSSRNAQLQQNLLISTLISQFLHEIRNPMHNLSAALEDGISGMDADQAQAVERALFRFDEIALRYKNWEASVDKLDPREPVLLKPWLESFARDHLGSDLKGLSINYEQRIEPILVRFHPVLLEQVLNSVVANAFETLEASPTERHLQIVANLTAPSGERNVDLRVLNSGGIFSEDVLKTQARSPVSSRQGIGFGLLLTRHLLEQAKGGLRLENIEGMACVTLVLSGERV